MPSDTPMAGNIVAPHAPARRARRERPRTVVAIGTNYSGSTLLSMLLDCHPQIVSIGEGAPNRHAQARQRAGQSQFLCSCRHTLADCPFFRDLFARMQAQGFPLDADHWITDYKYRSALLNTALGMYSARRWFRSLQNLTDDYLPGHRSRLRETTRARVAFVRTILEATGKDVFFDATKYVSQAHYMAHAPGVDVKLLRILRDPRSYVGSSKRRGREVEERAHNWVHFNQATNHMLAAVPSERIMVMRYEDLGRSPVDMQRKLYAFFGVDDVPAPTAVVPQEHHVIGNTLRMKDRLEIRLVESWREELTTAEQDLVLRIAGPLAEQLGIAL